MTELVEWVGGEPYNRQADRQTGPVFVVLVVVAYRHYLPFSLTYYYVTAPLMLHRDCERF